jgi:hypothetical protein
MHRGVTMKKSLVVLTATVAMSGAGMFGLPPAGAGEFHFNAGMWSRAFETYGQIPAEATQGAPSAIVQLQGPSVTPCEARAGVYDLGTVLDEYLDLSLDVYKNPTRVVAVNPASAYPTHAEYGSAPGPRAVADCATPEAGTASATWGGPDTGQNGVASATSRSTTSWEPGSDLIITEGSTKLGGIKLGDASIRTLESWLRVEWRPNQDPLVSYRIVLQGLFSGSTEVASGGGKGLVLSGQSVGGSELSKQFNEQAAAHQNALSALGRYGFHILAPRHYYDPRLRDQQPGGHIVEAPVLEGSWGFTARQNQTGHNQGMRLGLTRAVSEIWVR